MYNMKNGLATIKFYFSLLSTVIGSVCLSVCEDQSWEMTLSHLYSNNCLIEYVNAYRAQTYKPSLISTWYS